MLYDISNVFIDMHGTGENILVNVTTHGKSYMYDFEIKPMPTIYTQETPLKMHAIYINKYIYICWIFDRTDRKLIGLKLDGSFLSTE